MVVQPHSNEQDEVIGLSCCRNVNIVGSMNMMKIA